MSEPSAGSPARLLTTHSDDRARLRARHAAGSHVVVAVLCAQWCTTCREFLPMLEGLAARLPRHSWVWIDIEDDAALVGDVDIETFPTLAVYVDATLAHFGPVLPNAALVERLVERATPSLRGSHSPVRLPQAGEGSAVSKRLRSSRDLDAVADVHADVAGLVRALIA